MNLGQGQDARVSGMCRMLSVPRVSSREGVMVSAMVVDSRVLQGLGLSVLQEFSTGDYHS